MVKIPFKSLVTFLQIRHLGTTSSKLVEPTLIPVVTTQVLTDKSQRKKEIILSEKEKLVITLLKKQHFSDTQIASLVNRAPILFRSKVKSNLEPKFDFLVENGFVGSFLAEIIVKNPAILRYSLCDNLAPNIKYLRELMGNDQAALLSVIKRSDWLLSINIKKIVQPNIDLLLEEGMRMDAILKQFTSVPRTFICSIDRMRHGVDTIKKFGISPSENMFTYGLRMVLSLSESTLNRKIALFKSLGWSDEALKMTIANSPLSFSQSEDKIKNVFHFLVKDMGLQPKYLMTRPKLLMYSLTKRIVPRCKVVMTLKEKKLLKDFRFPGIIYLSEEVFSRRFILKYPSHSSDLLQIYRGNEKVDDIAVQ